MTRKQLEAKLVNVNKALRLCEAAGLTEATAVLTEKQARIMGMLA